MTLLRESSLLPTKIHENVISITLKGLPYHLMLESCLCENGVRDGGVAACALQEV